MHKILQRSLSRRALFASNGDFSRHLYDRLLLRTKSLPLPARKSAYRLGLAGCKTAFVGRYGSTDFVMLSEIFISGEYERTAESLETNRPAIVDLGANAGYSIRYWGSKFANARIFAVEPDPSNSEICRQNIEIAGMNDRTILLQAAVVGHTRPVFLDRSSDECSFHVSDDRGAGPAVTGVTMEEILARFGIAERLDLLKCDIEGAEAEVFHGCSAWIRRFRFVVVETHPPYTINDLISDLEANGASPQPVCLREKGSGLGLALIRLATT